MKFNLALILLFTTTLNVSCYHSRYKVDSCERCNYYLKESTNGKSYKIHSKFYFWGLYPSKLEYVMEDLCENSEVKEIHEYTSFSDGIYENFTLGMYTPRTMDISCF